ncbi:MAG: hypothetical protein II721_02125, partial [Bacilli bacterium]|nr:hypothetical protein [Bacilli bacterium]
MKSLKALLLLTPTALLALASCGAPAPSSSSSSIFSSEESKTSATSSKEADTSISSSNSEESQSSEESKTSGESVSSKESVSSEEESLPEVTEYSVPTTEKEYFQQLNRATKSSEEANDIRIYTPHANVKRKIDKNGYASAQFGMHFDLDVNSPEAQEIMSELNMDDE